MEKNQFKTRDIGLASALSATGHNLIDVVKSQGNPWDIFIFDFNDDIIKDKDNYFAHNLPTDAFTLVGKYRELKQRVKEGE